MDVKDYIFSSIDTSALNLCFVQYDPAREEIYFCYKSSDDMAEFTNGSDATEQLSLTTLVTPGPSWISLTSTLGLVLNVDTVETYATASATYDPAGSTYASQDAGFTRNVLMLSQASSSDGLSSSNIFGLDGIDEGINSC